MKFIKNKIFHLFAGLMVTGAFGCNGDPGVLSERAVNEIKVDTSDILSSSLKKKNTVIYWRKADSVVKFCRNLTFTDSKGNDLYDDWARLSTLHVDRRLTKTFKGILTSLDTLLLIKVIWQSRSSLSTNKKVFGVMTDNPLLKDWSDAKWEKERKENDSVFNTLRIRLSEEYIQQKLGTNEYTLAGGARLGTYMTKQTIKYNAILENARLQLIAKYHCELPKIELTFQDVYW